MKDCLFCQIVAELVPAKIAGESETILAFHDIHPKAPVHLLLIPKVHHERPSDLTSTELVELVDLADELAEKFKVKESGYRLVFNVGRHAGQEIDHVHLHLIGGRTAQSMY